MSVNKAILIGRLGRDPELKYTPSGRAVTNFSIATTEKWSSQDGTKQEKTVWHNIVAWGKVAEVMKEYLHKGKEVYIEGRIDNRSYDKKDGSGKGYISEVIVQNFQFIGSRGDAGSAPDQSGSPNHSGASNQSGAPSDPPAPGNSGGDDDLPF